MPFERYLRYDENADDESDSFQSYNDPQPIQFQIPQFMFNGPTLAPGGGAEVLPVMFSNAGNVASPWFNNNGFSTEKFIIGLSTSTEAAYMSYSDVPFDCDQQLKMGSSSSSDDTQVTSSHQFHSSRSIPPDGKIPIPTSTNDLLSNARLNIPSPLGLPVYSVSGFDILSILSRVATRPHPKVVLGPVDLTCSFVVVDVRRYDRPIVYASPSFCQLTGYAEHEVLGRNCRFLQAPDGNVKKGDERRFVAPETVHYMYKSVIADKECQASIVNYRKGGEAFINLVTVIPLPGGVHNRPEETDEVVYQIGFQVDLTKQPNAILQKLQDGSYVVNYGAGKSITPPPSIPLHDRKSSSQTSKAISKDLHSLLTNSFFLQSIPISSNTTAPSDSAQESNQMLNLLLLESSPDFIHVLSLKGSFLYVAPSVRRILGFEPEELVGKSVADFCHPADLIPLMRELKEASTNVSASHDEPSSITTQASPNTPKKVDLLFRAQSKSRGFIWVECRGRMHVESGKGRKAIILSGRARGMLSMEWGAVARAGGLAPGVYDLGERKLDGGSKGREREFWGMLSAQGTFLMVGPGVRDVLGWRASELAGKSLLSLVVADENGRVILRDRLSRLAEEDEPAKVVCEMSAKEGWRLPVHVILYQSREQIGLHSPTICQIQILDSFSSPPTLFSPTHSHDTNIFEELDTNRGSSWQYELQQLKFANQRLLEEANKFEGTILSYGQHLKTISPDHFSFNVTGGNIIYTQGIDGETWSLPHLREPEVQRSLKRSWDSDSSLP